MTEILEGRMPYLGHETYYRITCPEEETKIPLILLHGGPGSSHNYFEVLDPLAENGRKVINYDQIGCGQSYLDQHPELWTMHTWVEELASLIEHLGLKKYHLLGQSWGGMLAITWALDPRSTGLSKLILSSTLSSSALWGKEQHRNIRYLPPEEQNAIREAEKTGNWESEAVQAATAHFMEQHSASAPENSDPECLRRPRIIGKEAYLYGWGPNEYSPMGSLKNYETTPFLKNIKVPTLIISGTDDLCTPLIAKTMYDNIPDTRWELFEGARHMCFVEQTERYIALLNDFLND